MIILSDEMETLQCGEIVEMGVDDDDFVAIASGAAEMSATYDWETFN